LMIIMISSNPTDDIATNNFSALEVR